MDAAARTREQVKQSIDSAPEPVVSAIADILEESARPAHGERLIVVRLHHGGFASAEVFSPANGSFETARRPASLLDAFKATGEPYREALRRGRESKRERLEQEGGMLTVVQVGELLGLSRQAVDKRRRAGKLFGLSLNKRGILYPAWQFVDGEVLSGFETVQGDLSEHSPWSRVIFWLTPTLWLDGETPLAELRRGHLDEVRRAAQSYGEHGAP